LRALPASEAELAGGFLEKVSQEPSRARAVALIVSDARVCSFHLLLP
jgi:hypothetical protein